MEIPRETFEALASPTRLEILRALRDKQLRCEDPADCDLSSRCCNVGELVEALDLTQPTISHHLKELRTAGLITTHREGRTTYCGVDEETFEELGGFIETFVTKGRDVSCG